MNARRQRTRVIAVAASTVALGLVLVACGNSSESASADATTSDQGTASAAPVEQPSDATPADGGASAAAVDVPESLNFRATTVSGDAFRGAQVAGKPVVLWFWAPWCAVCRSQAPQVEKLVSTYGEDLAVIGVGSLDSAQAISGFADDVSGPTHLSDPDGKLWKRFRISEQSSFVVLDGTGREVLRTGYNDDDALADAVESVVS